VNDKLLETAREGRLIGSGPLLRAAYHGADLTGLGELLLARAGSALGQECANALMDLSVVLQLKHNPDMAMTLQKEALAISQVYHLPASGKPALNVLAIMAPGDLMANTPLEFLIESGDVSLTQLYLPEGGPFPEMVPDHDVAFIAVCESDKTTGLLQRLTAVMKYWPRPVINLPQSIARLSRNEASHLLGSLPGINMPMTARASRSQISRIGNSSLGLDEILPDGHFPIIIRPVGSHAGFGLERIEQASALKGYLERRAENDFYVARFVDYRGDDQLYRKYRIALVGGKPFACHMGISSHWMIHYVNAGMADNPAKKGEEAGFMTAFHDGFASRHQKALTSIHERMGLDYLVMDCAEDRDGNLLVFEVDNGAVVHDMDSPEIYPYKQAAMKKVFGAFRDLLGECAGRASPSFIAFPSTPELLVSGGDERIQPDENGMNRYGCQAIPALGVLELGSSTTTNISRIGYEAADRLRNRMASMVGEESLAAVYRREMARQKQEFMALTGLSGMILDMEFSPSGSDVHQAAVSRAGRANGPLTVVMLDDAETGSSVPSALLGGCGEGRVQIVAVAVREADGTPRETAAVEADFRRAVAEAIRSGRHVLLIQVDVSKTGLIVPSLSCTLALKRAFGDQLDVLVDACQFRLAPATLRAYLERGFMVGVTGSKFASGPGFSGALMVQGHEAPADEGSGVPERETLNLGMMLRWEAALAELRAFASLSEERISRFLQRFSRAVQERLLGDVSFEPLPVPVLDRFPLVARGGWDQIPTIFPFVLMHSNSPKGRIPFSPEDTAQVHRTLQSAYPSVRLGQPVRCGTRNGEPVSALRLCAGVRLIVEALSGPGQEEAAIERTLRALDKVAMTAARIALSVAETEAT
jgi:hypothetical protein